MSCNQNEKNEIEKYDIIDTFDINSNDDEFSDIDEIIELEEEKCINIKDLYIIKVSLILKFGLNQEIGMKTLAEQINKTIIYSTTKENSKEELFIGFIVDNESNLSCF